jgi:hypothetical protein
VNSPADGVPPAGHKPERGNELPADAEPARDAEPSEAGTDVNGATALIALIGIVVALAIGGYLLAQGSALGAGLLVLGVIYIVWLAAAMTGADKAMVVAISLIAVFCIVWAIVNAAVYHSYHYAVAFAAYGLWAFMTNVRTFAEVKSRRSALLLVAGHGLALLAFLFIDLSWQLDTAVALAAIVLVLAAGVAMGSDQENQETTKPAASVT